MTLKGINWDISIYLYQYYSVQKENLGVLKIVNKKY